MLQAPGELPYGQPFTMDFEVFNSSAVRKRNSANPYTCTKREKWDISQILMVLSSPSHCAKFHSLDANNFVFFGTGPFENSLIVSLR